jgi:tyrosyl-DNA phosphodiesterase 2
MESSEEELAVFRYEGGEWKTRKSRPTPVPIKELSVLTWNVWFGAHMFDERRAALMTELERRKPDVICLQEVTFELLADLTQSPWVRAAYHLSDVELFQTYDVVMLSRQPVRRMSQLSLPTQMGRRLLVTELACGLTIATVHLESMKQSTQPRATQLRLIQPHLAQLGNAVLCGDMNFKPDDAVETAAIDPGFVDVWPVLRPEDPGYTADSEINKMRYALKPAMSRKRIDRVFVHGAPWKATAIDLVGTTPIDSEGNFTSDHFGLACTLSI